MNDAIVEANDASANWEDLLRRTLEAYDMQDEHDIFGVIDLSDSKADLYDFHNELQMRVLPNRLVEALQSRADADYVDRKSLDMLTLKIGNQFFAILDEPQQRRFFREVVALPLAAISFGEVSNNDTEKPAITICTSALLAGLSVGLNSEIDTLQVGNFALRNQSHVEALSGIIRTMCDSLCSLRLEGVECPVDYTMRNEDGPIGFLDPLVFAFSRAEELRSFQLSARTPPVHSSLVSPRAVRSLLGEGRRLYLLDLCSLGLNDSHCLDIADELRTTGAFVRELDLKSNPAISDQGYNSLLDLINRANVIQRFSVDDKDWEAKLNLVSEMNRECGRLEYMTNGNFASEERRWEWLEKLVTSPPSWNDNVRYYNDEETDDYYEEGMPDYYEEGMPEVGEEEEAAKQVNYIWYELLQHPEFIQT
jgi:hypothetical protein